MVDRRVRSGHRPPQKPGQAGDAPRAAAVVGVPCQHHLLAWLRPLIKALAPAGRAPWRAQPLWRPSPKVGRR